MQNMQKYISLTMSFRKM